MEVSQEKTKVVNVKRRYSEFLGFKIKVHTKGSRQVVKSHISDKQLMTKKKVLVKQVKRIARPRPKIGTYGKIRQYNLMVMGMQNYYRIAIKISLDVNKLNRAVMAVIINRLDGISRKGRKLTPAERTRYGKSVRLRFIANEPIYPIGYVQHKIPKLKGGTDEYENLIPVTATIHKLIHATNVELIHKYLQICKQELCGVGKNLAITSKSHLSL